MFRVFKIFFRTLFFSLFCAAAFWASRAENPRDGLEELARLPDCDFAGLAENCWAEGKRAEAFACLEYAVSNKTGDAGECAFLLEKYLKSVELRNSAWGRLCAVGRGFATGDVDGADALAGAALSDLLLYGDLRDIVKETAINEKADPFVLALASAGAATTLFPPADGALSLAKIAKRAGSLAAPLEKSILRALKSALKSPPAKAAEELKKNLGPIAALSEKTKTWTGFSAVLKSADSPEGVSKICALIDKSPDNAAKLEQILFISGKNAKRSFDFIVENSQRGMDFLYSAMRKGPRAAEFAARHPSFAARAAKNAYKGYPLAAAEIADAAAALFGKSEALRWLAVFCLSAAAAAAALPYGYIFSAAREIDKARFRARAVAGAAILCALLGAAATAAFAHFANPPEGAEPVGDVEQPDSAFPISRWADAVCDVNFTMEEDAYINESFDISVKAPIVETDAGKFAVCGFDAVGFGLKQIADGGVYKLGMRVRKRGGKPFSFSPKSVFADADGRVFIPVENASGTALGIAGDCIDAGEIALFSKNFGFKSSPAEISVPSPGVLNVISECEDGDSIVTRGGKFYGVVVKAKKSATCAKTESSAPAGFREIPLTKPDSETYYRDFMRAILEISKERGRGK